MAVGAAGAAGGAGGSAVFKGIAAVGLAATGSIVVMTAAIFGGMGSAAANSCGDTSGGSQPYVSQEPSGKAVSDIPGDYLTLYRSAASEEGIDWAVLAAVGKVETGHGSNMNTSSAGAQGPMQFMPDTWASVGRDANGDGTADVMDPEDAIPTAATYLRDNGAPDDYTQALFAYNHSDAYVQEVLGIAEEYRAADSEGTLALMSAVAVVRDATTLGMEIPVASGQMNGSNAVDENRNMHYESNTSYGSAWDHAVSSWNAGGAVNVAPSPGGDETDLYVGDGDLPGTTMGHTSISGGDGGEGEIVFDSPIMDGATQNAQNAAASHELGHAFSFEHTENASVMYTPINSGSSSNWETPTDYDWSVYNDRWGGGTPQEGSGGGEQPSPDQPSSEQYRSGEPDSDEPDSDKPSPQEPEGGGSDDPAPAPDTGSEEYFQSLFGEDYEGQTPSEDTPDATSGGTPDGDNRQTETNSNRQIQTNSNHQSQSSGGDPGTSGGGQDPDALTSGDEFPFNIFGDEDGGGGEEGNRDGGGNRGEQMEGENDGGGGNGGEQMEGENNGGGDQSPNGNAESGGKAVFPLPQDYHDDYQNDWGAARSQGGHEGTDIFAPDGTPISSITAGTVVKSGWDDLGGNTVLIEATQDVGPVKAGDQLYYAHMQDPSPLRPGDTVAAGDTVGNVGSTGEGPPGTLLPEGRGQHLHLGWYDETGNRAETASGAMNPYDLLTWLADNGGEATGGPAAPGACPPEDGTGSPDGGSLGSPDGASPDGGGQYGGGSPGSRDGDAAVAEAEKYMGVPYVLGGPEACIPGEQMDCTCLTTTVFKAVGGYELPDWPQSLHDYGEPVSEGDLQAGDVVIYNDPGDGTGGHVGIAINSTEMIHACLPCGETVIGPIFDVPNYGGARRLV